MTKEELTQGYYLIREIREWQKKLLECDLEPDSIEHICAKVLELKRKKEAVTEFIMNIEDSQTRLIFKLRCLDGLTWNQIADRIGGLNSEDTMKKRFYRYLKKTAG